MVGIRALPRIRREVVSLDSQGEVTIKTFDLIKVTENYPARAEPAPIPQVLVINASVESSREITFELSRSLPGCSVLFAPTLRLALWLLKRRNIDVVVTNNILPDGSLHELEEYLTSLPKVPELLVTGNIASVSGHFVNTTNYRVVECRSLLADPYEDSVQPKVESAIRNLGADIRNDLNNPLQEIVAMAFVVQASNGLSPAAEHALDAISKVAKNMSSVVNSLEQKIRQVVG